MSYILKFLFKFLMPFIAWAEPSVTGNDNKASGRKISSVVFMIMIISTTGKLLAKDDVSLHQLYLLIVLVATFLLLQGIITIQNIADIWKNGSQAPKVEKPAPAQQDQPQQPQN